MSKRTIIEINHDHAHDLRSDGYNSKILHELVSDLAWPLSDNDKAHYEAFGVRILAQRDASEVIALKVE